MLTIFKGDDTNGRFGRVLNLNITVAEGTSLDGCRAEFAFDGVVREFTNIVSGTPVQLVFGHDETAAMAEGIRYATLRIYDPDDKVRTFDNTIAVKVTSNVAEAYPGSDTATISISGSVAWVDITGKPSWIGSSKPSYTANEVGALPCTTNADLTKNVGIHRVDFLRAAVGVGCVATGGTTGGAFAVGRNLRAYGEYGMAGGHRAMTADGAKYAFAFGNRTYAATGSVAFGYQAWSAAAGQFLNDDTDVVSGLGSKHKYSFVWQGKDDSTPGYYHTHGDGTFNINPIGGTAGFYIGEQSLPQVIAASVTGKLDATAQAADSAKLGGTAADAFALKTDNAPGLTDDGVTALFASAATSMQTSGSALNSAAIAAITGANKFATWIGFNELNYRFDYFCNEDIENSVNLTRIVRVNNTDLEQVKTINICTNLGNNGLTISIGQCINRNYPIDAVLFIGFGLSGSSSASVTWNLGTVGDSFYPITEEGTTWDEVGGSWDPAKNYIVTITELSSCSGIFLITKKEVVVNGL